LHQLLYDRTLGRELHKDLLLCRSGFVNKFVSHFLLSSLLLLSFEGKHGLGDSFLGILDHHSKLSLHFGLSKVLNLRRLALRWLNALLGKSCWVEDAIDDRSSLTDDN